MSGTKTAAPASAETESERGNVESLGERLNQTDKQESTVAQLKALRDVYNFHPAAEKYRLLEGAELDALAADIKKQGVRAPVVFWTDAKGKKWLLDGRNRIRGALRAGVAISQVPIKNLSPSVDPYAFVLSANAHRRHLSAEEIRERIAEVLKASPEKSDRQIAEEVKEITGAAKGDHKKVGRVRQQMQSTGTVPQLSKRTGKDGKSRPAKKPRNPAKAKPKSPDRAPELPGNVVLPGAPDFPAPEARAKAEEAEYEKVVAAYSTLAPNVKQRFLDYVIAGQTASVIDAALARLEDHTRRELADRILRTPPDMEAAS